MTCPSCGGGGVYVHCCLIHGRAIRQPCKTCKSEVQTSDPDCPCFDIGGQSPSWELVKGGAE